MLMPDDEGNTAVHYAVLGGSLELLQFLMRKSAGCVVPGIPLVAARNAAGETPLLRAAAAENSLAMVKFLLQCSSDPFAADGNRNTVFHNAARNGRLWVVVALLEHISSLYGPAVAHALLNQGDIDAHTPLEWACYSGHLSVVRFLIREGLVSE